MLENGLGFGSVEVRGVDPFKTTASEAQIPLKLRNEESHQQQGRNISAPHSLISGPKDVLPGGPKIRCAAAPATKLCSPLPGRNALVAADPFHPSSPLLRNGFSGGTTGPLAAEATVTDA
ncbi:hypothetical protein G2W53_025076 [Senna tora]|uniref:Uncharacterized protein n=1 Tax=Senna tora TaxID=362788 RepID=A0A834WHJ5_9FABA|nr:hypothetical protein G2W53_025076 [Senna tora]